MSERESAGDPRPERDPALDRAYAAGAREEPPASLDAAIRAAARRGVHAGPRRAADVLRFWRMPVAIAAVLVLSVSVVLLMREEGADRLDDGAPATAAAPAADPPAAQPGRPASEAESAPPAAPAPGLAAITPRDAPAPRNVEVDLAPKRRAAAREAPATPSRPSDLPRSAPHPFVESPAPPPEPSKAAPAMPPSRAVAKEARSGASAGSGLSGPPPSAPPGPPPPAAAEAAGAVAGKLADKSGTELARSPARKQGPMRAQESRRDESIDTSRPAWFGLDGQPPEKWLARVEELRRAGRETEAEQVLAEFRRRYPEHPVPAASGK